MGMEDDMDPAGKIPPAALKAVQDSATDDNEPDMDAPGLSGAPASMPSGPNKIKGGMPQTIESLQQLGAGKSYGE